jgi:hypothetical protein
VKCFLVSSLDIFYSVTPLPFRGISPSNAVYSVNPSVRRTYLICFGNSDCDSVDNEDRLRVGHDAVERGK